MERNRRMLNNKWVATVSSIWIQSCVGGSYAFSIYSPILKSSQGYDQSTLDTVSVFKDIGANAGILSGLLYTAVTVNGRSDFLRRFGGPWVVHAVGAIQCFFGYFFIWSSVVGLIDRPPVVVMCFFMFVAAHSQTFFNTANVVCGVQNFADYGGTIVGIMKGFLGLSGAILIQVYDTVCKGKPSTFLLILALLPTLVSLLLMFLVRIHETRTGDKKKQLNDFSAVALFVAAYLMIIIILENIITFSTWAHIISFILLLLLLASPLIIAIKAQTDDLVRLPQPSSIDTNPLLKKYNLASDEGQHSHQKANADLQEEHNMNLLQSMRTSNFWMLFLAMICGMGSGLATINNISQIGQSLNYTTVEINNFVSLWSIWNFLGRFGAGYISDYFLHTRSWARPLFMVFTLATMTAGHIVIASGFPGNLYLGSILVGVCYGSQWSLMPTITSEIFGITHMGTIFNTIAIASPVGSYIFSVRVIGYLYDEEASGESNSCTGIHCFMLSFLIMASVSLFGTVVAYALYIRTKEFYRLLVLRKLNSSSS